VKPPNTIKTDSARLVQHISPIVTPATQQHVKVAQMANSSLAMENLVLPLALQQNTLKTEFVQPVRPISPIVTPATLPLALDARIASLLLAIKNPALLLVLTLNT